MTARQYMDMERNLKAEIKQLKIALRDMLCDTPDCPMCKPKRELLK